MRREDYFDHSPLRHLTNILDSSGGSSDRSGGGSSGNLGYVLTFDSYLHTIGAALVHHNFTLVSCLATLFFAPFC